MTKELFHRLDSVQSRSRYICIVPVSAELSKGRRNECACRFPGVEVGDKPPFPQGWVWLGQDQMGSKLHCGLSKGDPCLGK